MATPKKSDILDDHSPGRHQAEHLIPQLRSDSGFRKILRNRFSHICMFTTNVRMADMRDLLLLTVKSDDLCVFPTNRSELRRRYETPIRGMTSVVNELVLKPGTRMMMHAGSVSHGTKQTQQTRERGRDALDAAHRCSPV